MNIPKDLKYSQNDEWVRVDGSMATIGITDYAQEQLSDIVFLEILNSIGEEVKQDQPCATIESVKAASDVYAPVGGKIVEVNDNLPNTPETLNSDPYGSAWIVKIKMANPSEIERLMDSEAYLLHLAAKES
jgi:glycine cleavage system H protein